MRSAAVGFQCPSCVAEGARTTRQARAAYGGRRSGNPALTSIILVATNVAIWLGIVLTGGQSSWLLGRLAQRSLGQCQLRGGYYPHVDSASFCASATQGHWVAGVADGAPWQLLTSTFTHVEILHIGFNMLALWFLGPQLEMIVGRARFLALYLLSGMAGSTLVLYADPHIYTLGASGAIFGLMGALLVIAVRAGGNYQQILMWIGLNFLFTVVGRGFISWQAHLGGFIGGLLLTAALVYAPKDRRGLWQGLALAAYVAVLAVLIGWRVAQLG